MKWLLAKQLEDERLREMRMDPTKFKIVNRGGIIKRVNIDEEKERNKYVKLEINIPLVKLVFIA